MIGTEDSREDSHYFLELADGQRWRIISKGDATDWVSELATILQLSKCSQGAYRSLIIVRESEGISPEHCGELFPFLPATGWYLRDDRFIKFCMHGKTQDIICDIGREEHPAVEFVRMRHALYPIYRHIQENGGLPLHAALIERKGLGFLLLGRGGHGKSTCCRRIPAPWKALCDDETLIVKVGEGRYEAHPFPTWSSYINGDPDRSWDVRTQRHVHLAAAFFLEKSDTDGVNPVSGGKGAAMMTQSVADSWRGLWIRRPPGEKRNFRTAVFQNACELVKALPIFILRVSRNGRFWYEMEKVYNSVEKKGFATSLEG